MAHGYRVMRKLCPVKANAYCACKMVLSWSSAKSQNVQLAVVTTHELKRGSDHGAKQPPLFPDHYYLSDGGMS